MPEHVSVLESAASRKDSSDRKSPVTSLTQKMADVEAEVRQAHVELRAQNDRAMKLDAHA